MFLKKVVTRYHEKSLNDLISVYWNLFASERKKIMSHVPTWVYILFFALLYLGIKGCYTRVMTVKRLVIFPVVFIFFSLHSTILLFHFFLTGLLLLFLGGVVGGLLGYLRVRHRVIRADKQKFLIEIPGDIFILAMIIFIFAIEFFIHYAFTAHWAIAQVNLFKNCAAILTGLVAGISIGRNATYFFKYQQAESVDLVEKNKKLLPSIFSMLKFLKKI